MLEGGVVLKCERCGNDSRFYRENQVKEIAEYDGKGEFVDVIDADTKEAGTFKCYFCDLEIEEE